MACALGIDVGSTNVKTALVTDAGRVVASAQRRLETRRADVVAEQDPDALWAAVADAVAKTTAAAPAEAAAVTTLVCASQYSSIVPVDADGKALAPLITYMDRRGTDQCFAIWGEHPAAVETWLERQGIPPIGGGLSLAHLLYVRDDRPEVYAATDAFCEPMDFVNLRLTGRVAATQGTMFASQLCDNRTLHGTTYDDDLVRMAGLDAAKLPPLIRPADAVGRLLPHVAERLGLPATTTVYAAVNDSQAAAVATGVADPARAALVIGTTSVVLQSIPERRATDLDHDILSMPSALDHYLVWAENGLGGKALEHVLDHLVYATDALGDHGTPDAFAFLDRALASTPAAANGVLFLPWLGGSLAPDANPAMRGGFLNLSLNTTRADLVRASVEGLAYNARWLVDAVEGYSGRPIARMVFGGGGARSTVWAQILADVLDRPFNTLAEPETITARGAALLALVRDGVLAETEAGTMVPVAATYEPTFEHRAAYDTMFDQFVAAFAQTKPIFEALNG